MRDPNQYLLILIIFLLLTLYQMAILASPPPPPQSSTHRQCLDHQRSSLALLLRNLKIKEDYSPDAEFWDLKTDCCSWRGVACNGDGLVTKLDLNPISGTLERPILERVFQNLSFLVKLNLDRVDLSAQSSSWCEAISHSLPNLRVLSLSHCGLFGPICSCLSELRFLSALHLDGNLLSSIPPNFLVNSSDLLSLNLSNNIYDGSFPNSVFLLPKLRHIDISTNFLLSGQLPEFPSNTSVRFLSLSTTIFYGKLPWSISNLKSLRYLDLSNCVFSGVIPSSLAKHTHLVTLNLAMNGFNGSIPHFHRDDVPNLAHLILSDNQFNDILNSSLVTLPSLKELDLSSNKFSGELNEFPNASSSLLEVLDLSHNSFQGPIPRSIFELPSLEIIYLDDNNISGSLRLGNFQNQRNLTKLGLSGVSIESYNTSLASVQLEVLILTSCNFTEFPNFLNAQNSLTYIDLSNNQIKGYVPSWIWKRNLSTLDLSHNPIDFPKYPPFGMLNNSRSIFNFDANFCFPKLLTLRLSSCDITSFPEFLKNQNDLQKLDLSNNKLRGQIPSWIWNITGLQFLDLSDNSVDSFDQISLAAIPVTSVRSLDLHANLLHGSFPKTMCNFSQLSLLDMSYNHLSGRIPDCLEGIPLTVLNLQRNNFTSMPGFAQAGLLRFLKINGNKIQGKLPRSLSNCSQLEVLDLGDNMIRDAFPLWLDKLPALKMLVLRTNKFYGQIGNLGLVNIMPMLRVMDLCSNEFTGHLSKEFVRSLAAMQVTSNSDSKPKYVGDSYYHEESVTFMNKGLEMHMQRILTMFTCLDLSQNRFHGEIPEEIRYLKSLIVLNLSHNSFIGKIPSVMRNLTELESLDLSDNKLSGEIPRQLTGLTFLEVINLSYNQLEGSIPQGNQFDTFPNTSYEGNPRLCGPPLTKKCGVGAVPMPPPVLVNDEDSRTKNILDWKIVGMGYGSGLVIGFSIGYTIFSQMRIKWFTDLERRARKHGRRFRQDQRKLRSGRSR